MATRASQTGGMTASDEDAIALLRIELEDIEPLIWRRVAVPTSMSLKAVHNVIQAAMGWLDNHLWEFKTNEGKYGILIPNDPDWNERINNAATTKLSALLATGVTEIAYIISTTSATTGSTGSLSRNSSLPNPERCIPSSSAANGDARQKIAAASRAITTSSTISPANRARSAKLHSIGMAAPTTRTTSMSSRSPSISNALPTLDAPAGQNPSRHDACGGRLTLTVCP